MKKLSHKELLAVAGDIRLLVLDVDGVLTDGGIILDGRGNELKSFYVRDGHGIRMLIDNGIKVALITGRSSEVVKRRAEELGIVDVFQKCLDKKKALRQLTKKYSLADREIACMGDDIVDLSLLKLCGLPVTVADGHEVIREWAMVVTKKGGGRGAVREICDLILEAKGLLNKLIDAYS